MKILADMIILSHEGLAAAKRLAQFLGNLLVILTYIRHCLITKIIGSLEINHRFLNCQAIIYLSAATHNDSF